MKIKELQDGFKGTVRVLLTNVNRGVTNKGAPYLSFTLQDDSGVLDAKYWNVSEEALHSFEAGQIVDVYGDVITHQKQLQFRVNKATLVEGEESMILDYVPAGPYTQEELKEGIYGYIESFENSILKAIVQAVMKRHQQDFFVYPAAMRNHHDFVGGLATHVLGMLQMGESVCRQYENLHRDLLLAGILLHDVGKLVELSGAIVTEYTMQGKLLGHISIMQAEIDQIATEIGVAESEEAILLRHMVLSHHGVYEYGSPVLPMIPEAEVLYLLDNLDARMHTMKKTLANIAEGEFSQRVFALENRMLYKSKLGK